MTRRETIARLLILGAATLCAAPLVFAQSSQRIYRLAILELMSREGAQALDAALEKGLRELGYVEGTNLVIDRRFAGGHADRLPALAIELARTRPDVIFAPMTPTAQAAKAATNSIPIVIALASDPVASGFAQKLGRPGGNVTGTSNIQTDIDPKRIQILKEVLPNLRRAALVHAGDRLGEIQLAAAQGAGKSLGIEIISVQAQQPDAYKKGFALAKAHGADAMVVAANAQNGANARLIVELSAEHRVPAMYTDRNSAEVGGLISYGADPYALYHRAATFVDKIFKGADPATLPIEQASRFELVVNQKTARALGIKIPNSILLQATKVIE